LDSIYTGCNGLTGGRHTFRAPSATGIIVGIAKGTTACNTLWFAANAVAIVTTFITRSVIALSDTEWRIGRAPYIRTRFANLTHTGKTLTSIARTVLIVSTPNTGVLTVIARLTEGCVAATPRVVGWITDRADISNTFSSNAGTITVIATSNTRKSIAPLYAEFCILAAASMVHRVTDSALIDETLTLTGHLAITII
tara:strand:+ start:909 stop:1499 length:591 start_codon:yes stop_codon:yes gene_type:complete